MQEDTTEKANPGGGCLQWSDRWLVAAVVLVCGVLGLSIFRAATQSITHDEALTYNYFVFQPMPLMFDYSANNHILHTWLVKGVVFCLGNSVFAIRIPALAGAALYLGALVVLVRATVPSGCWVLISVALACLNPLVLDFFACARGYSLALAFMMWGIICFVRCADKGTWNRKSLFLCAMGSLCFGLSVATNLTFLFATCALGAMLVLLTLSRLAGRKTSPVSAPPQRDCRKIRLSAVAGAAGRFVAAAACLVLPGLYAAAVVIVPYLDRMEKRHFVLGYKELHGTMMELLDSEFFYRQTAMGRGPSVFDAAQPADWAATAFFGIVWGYTAITAFILLVGRLRRGWAAQSRLAWTASCFPGPPVLPLSSSLPATSCGE